MSRVPRSLAGLRTAATCAAILFASPAIGAQVAPTAPAPPSPVPRTADVDTGYVVYDAGMISFPFGAGLRLPGYNRVDGLVLPWGPIISLAGDRIRIDPTITYRSHIGKIDPFVKVLLAMAPGTEVEIAGGRGTFTNDGWIRSSFVNSLAVIGVGSDARNYFRADRVWVTLSHEIGRGGLNITPSVGALTEDDWSTGSPVRYTNAPWSILGETDSLKMRRPNPPIAKGRVSSALGRVKAEYECEDVTAAFDAALEYAFDAPPTQIVANGVRDPSRENLSGDFTQITLGSKAKFPTFGKQYFDFRGHAVFTPGDVAPPQRFAYLGGAGTLATVDLLALGGDKLFYVEGEYSIPIERIVIPFLGNPVASLRYAAGSAGVGELPDFIQNIGVGVGVRLLKVEYHLDPNYKKTPFSSKNAFSVSLSLSL